MGEIISGLVEYAIIHFTTEERLLKNYGYNDLANHKREHGEFKKHILELNNRYITDHSVSSMPLVQFVKDWFTKHIKMTDMKYVLFLKGKDLSLF